MAQPSAPPPSSAPPSLWRLVASWVFFVLVFSAVVYLVVQAILYSKEKRQAGRTGAFGNDSGKAIATSRQPAAVIEVQEQNKRYLVDAEGVVLSGPEEPGSLLLDLPLIVSPFPPQGQTGESWDVAEVKTAVSVADFLQNDWSTLGLKQIRIEVSGLFTEIRLITTGGSEVLWCDFSGRPEATTPEEKRLRLVNYVREFGSLDAPAGPYLFDPRPAEGLLRTRRSR